MIQQKPHRVQAFVVSHLIKALLDPVSRVALSQTDLLRIAQITRCHFRHIVGIGRREQERLAPRSRRATADDRRDILCEPHVQHPVGLIENQRVESAQRQ